MSAPNKLWHIDGNHKPIRWGFYIHGGIDSFSRILTFLKLSLNNLAETVLEGFSEVVNEYGLTSRVRTDTGSENVAIQ